MRSRLGFALLALLGLSSATLGCSSPSTPDGTTTDSVGDGNGGAPPGPVTGGPQPPNSVPNTSPMPTPPGSATATTMPTPGNPPTSMPGNGGSPPLPASNGGTPPVANAGAPGVPANSGGAAAGGTTGVGGVDTMVGGAVGIAGMNPGGSNSGGGGGAAVPEDVVPTVTGEDYSLALPSATFVANGPTGRITQLAVGGTNRLTTSSVNPMNYGSSFWTAPQSVWNWPPPLDAVDETTPRTDYVHAIEGNSIVFTSPATDQGEESVSIVKRFTADAARDVFVLDFTVTNEGSSAISIAPWQISRVVPQGFTFYPTGTEVTADAIPTSDIDGVTWLDYSDSSIADGTKNIADGAEGWLAHVNGTFLFLMVFPEISQQMAAPGEGEVEIYVDTPTSYVELEPQGPYAAVQPGATSPAWQVLWVVRAVPAEVDVSLGSTSLVEWVRSVVASL